jgi:hypothetical protein
MPHISKHLISLLLPLQPYTRVSSSDRKTDRVVLTMMSAGLGACRGHAVVDPTYATEKKGNTRHYDIHAAFNTTDKIL